MGPWRAAVVVSALTSAVWGCSSFGESAAPMVDAGGGESEAAPAVLAPSCKALLAEDPSLSGKNGVYDIAPVGDSGAPLRVYCDLTLDKGGWTLVGRSAASSVTRPFGWKVGTGDVNELGQAYSLDVAGAKLAFTEVLVGDRAPASPGVNARAYKFAVSPDFLEHDDTVSTGNVVTVLGDCAPSGGPSMLHNAGATSLTDGFFLRDVPGVAQHRGLQLVGFDLASYDDCARGGFLDGLQGVVLVR